jgi:hypothetical protein
MSVEQPRGIPANELQPIYESPFIMNTPIFKIRNVFGVEMERACKAERNITLTWATQTTMKIGSQHGKTRGFWYPRKRKVQRKDIERLGEGEWLGDEIINSCAEAITREANPKVFMMNSLKFASVEKAIPTGRLRLGKYHTRLAESRYFVVPSIRAAITGPWALSSPMTLTHLKLQCSQWIRLKNMATKPTKRSRDR